MRWEKAARRDRHHDRARTSAEQVDEQSIARRTEQGARIMGAAVVLMTAVPMLMEAIA